jgi:hypothetical protein
LLPLAVFAAEPAQRWHLFPEWLCAYLNHSTGSLFPVLPWTGFVCAGFLASKGHHRPGSDSVGTQAEPPHPRSHSLLTASSAVVVALIFFSVLPILLPASAAFFFQILAWLLLAVPVVRWLAPRCDARWLHFAGRESLILYAAHLLLIELLAITVLPRSAFGVAACAAIFGAVLASTGAIGVLWMQSRAALARRAT